MQLNKFYNYFTREFSKYMNMYNPDIAHAEGIPEIMPAFGHDIGNYAARYGMGNYTIQIVLKLGGKLDYEKLSRAVRLSVDAEPVLGCRFVEHDPPYWKRLSDLDNIEFCSLVNSDSPEETVQNVLESHLDMDRDPMLKVTVIRSGNYDTLVIKINHTCSDGGGAKEYLHLLPRIYSSIDGENEDYAPTPSKRSRKDHEKAFATLGIRHPELDNSVVESPKTAWPFPWKSGGQKDVTPFVVCRLPYGKLESISKYARQRGVTVNDVILTAFYRAMFKLCQTPPGIPMDMGVTVDLRRYLPDNKAEAIRNFSGGVILQIARLIGEPFEVTLSRVSAAMARKKNRNPGYECATGAERAEKLSFRQALTYFRFISKLSEFTSNYCFYCSPGLSNLGLLSRSLLRFGDTVVTDAYIIPPVIRAPGLMLVASSYNGTLTLATGYYKGSVNRRHMEKLLNKIMNELLEGCKPKQIE